MVSRLLASDTEGYSGVCTSTKTSRLALRETGLQLPRYGG